MATEVTVTKDELIAMAKACATQHLLDPVLVCSVVEQESAWDTWAVRYEPAFQTRYIDPLNLSATETMCRSTSWGLMQVMGQTAYEAGFRAKAPTLLSPALGLYWGCTVLAKKLRKAQNDVEKALLLWNGGANKLYPAEVLARMDTYK